MTCRRTTFRRKPRSVCLAPRAAIRSEMSADVLYPRLSGRGALGRDVERVDRLARRHEQAIAVRAAECEVAADLGKANPAEELPGRIPDRDAAVAERAAGVARHPDVSGHVRAQ